MRRWHRSFKSFRILLQLLKVFSVSVVDITSNYSGRFTAGIKEQRIRLPQISLSPHDKPQTIGLMNGKSIKSHSEIISGKFATTKSYIPKTLTQTAPVETSEAEISVAASFGPEDQIHQKVLTLRPNGERLGINLTWGMETSLKEAGLYIQAVHPYGVADLAGCLPGDR